MPMRIAFLTPRIGRYLRGISAPPTIAPSICQRSKHAELFFNGSAEFGQERTLYER